MFNLLFKFIFSLINKVFSILLSPFITAITVLFPDLSNVASSITTFISYGVTYISFARDLLLIPTGALSMLFSYYLIKYSVYLINISIKFIVNVYNTLKP